MSERWLPVIDYEGYYEVSDQGRVRRVGKARGATVGRILALCPDGHGYLRVTLYKHDQRVKYAVHELVAAAFLGPRPRGLIVNHKDGVKPNNAVDNLEWCTYRHNNMHALEHGLRSCTPLPGELNGRAVLSEAQVLEILAAKGKASQRMLSRRYGVARTTVQAIHQGRLWPHLSRRSA